MLFASPPSCQGPSLSTLSLNIFAASSLSFHHFVLTLGRAYFVEGEPESENPLPQAYVEVYMLIVIYLTIFIVIEQYLGSENVCLDEMK
jgi:hypothetical protein